MTDDLQQLGASPLYLNNVMSRLWLIATRLSKLSALFIISEQLTHYWSCLSPGEGHDLEPFVGEKLREKMGILLTAFLILT